MGAGADHADDDLVWRFSLNYRATHIMRLSGELAHRNEHRWWHSDEMATVCVQKVMDASIVALAKGVAPGQVHVPLLAPLHSKMLRDWQLHQPHWRVEGSACSGFGARPGSMTPMAP